MHRQRSRILREQVPLVELHQYNQIYPTLNVDEDNDEISLKERELLQIYLLPNAYYKNEGFVVSAILIHVINLYLT